MSKLLVGFAEESLMHEKRIRLGGQFYERISEGVESEITATAMAVTVGEEQMIMVSSDLTSAPEYLVDRVRKIVANENKEIDPMKITVSATHTHTSHLFANPDTKSVSAFSTTILKEMGASDKEYKPLVTADDSVLDPADATIFVAEKIAKAVLNAWANRQEMLYANEFGRAAVGMCRRVCYNDGSAQMWGDVNTAAFTELEGGNDSGVELLYFFDTNKELKGIVANIACPSQILEHRNLISADYWGRAKAIIREKLGKNVYLLGLGGAAGDQCPRDLVRWVQPETPVNDPNIKRPNVLYRKADPSMFDVEGCTRAGKRVANEILSVLEEITELKSEPVFYHKVIDMQLPLRKATLEQYNHAVREIEYFVDKNKNKESFTFEDTAAIHVHTGTIQRFKEQQNTEIFNIEAHVIRFGDVALITNPFELFLNFGNRIKARSYAHQTFIAQLTNGRGGYLPTEKAEKGGHYSAYISSGNVGHEGGDLYARLCIEEINKMFSK